MSCCTQQVPGNFHVSTHSAESQPENPDMTHIIHKVRFGMDLQEGKVKSHKKVKLSNGKLTYLPLFCLKIKDDLKAEGILYRSNLQVTCKLGVRIDIIVMCILLLMWISLCKDKHFSIPGCLRVI